MLTKSKQVVMAVASFLITAFAPNVWVSLIGVGFGSVGSGFGELTFLAYSAFFHKDTISTWSSGQKDLLLTLLSI